jgi:hypothetical protein
VTIADVQRSMLDAGTVLVEYALGEERSYLWAVTRDGVQVRTLPARAVIEAAVRRAYQGVSVNDPVSAKQSARALAELADMLIGTIPAVRSAHRLVFVPDGALESSPSLRCPDDREDRSWQTAKSSRCRQHRSSSPCAPTPPGRGRRSSSPPSPIRCSTQTTRG